MADINISIIMPVRNAAPFLRDALSWLSAPEIIEHRESIEVILVDDNSCDDPLSVLGTLRDGGDIVRYVKNPGTGKVSALNYGYSLSRGRCVKFIDADDVLERAWFTLTEAWTKRAVEHWAEAHAATLVDGDLKPITVFKPPSFKERDEAFRKLLSVPRWSWCLSRSLCENIFPLPTELPFEDVWIAAGVVRWADQIHVLGEPVYLYRQHDRQTYGGALNFSKGVVTIRSRRMQKVVDCMIEHAGRFGMKEAEVSRALAEQMDYWCRLEDYDAGLLSVIKSGLSARLKIKVLLQQNAPKLCGWAVRLKWFWDGIRTYT